MGAGRARDDRRAGFAAMSMFPGTARNAQAAQSGPGSFANLAKMASPSGCQHQYCKSHQGRRGGAHGPSVRDDPLRDFFERFYRNQKPRDYKQQSLGTGFIIDKDGFILTNNHVVEQTDEIKVKLADDREFDAQNRRPRRQGRTWLSSGSSPDGPLEALSPRRFRQAPGGETGCLPSGIPSGLGHTVTAGDRQRQVPPHRRGLL